MLRISKKDTDLSFTENEAVTIIKYALDNPDYHNLAIATLITTGLRAGELLALKPSDVQIEFGRLIVDKMEVTKSYEIVDRCKDDSNGIVYLNSDAKLILSKVLELRNCEKSECEFLFLNHSSDYDKMHLRAIDNRIRKLQ
ncbi:MAG: tyrosine-type recombinase/integrase, partial [Prevotellaceae bacterium]|nr:tyrosine-type recombinase/integrase [Prevotellaceae bacterium]